MRAEAMRAEAPRVAIAATLGILLASAMLPAVARAQDGCPRAALPAYAHNDYENARPLHDALALGYRGAEADVFVVEGTLRVGHDRAQAERGPTLEDAYFAPLAALVRRCGTLTADGRPFLLTLEFKRPSAPGDDALAALVARYRAAFSRDGQGTEPAVLVVLVGFHPATLPRTPDGAAAYGVHWRLARPDVRVPPALSPDVRLISVDYGKTMGRRWTRAATRRRWLATLRAAKAAAPDRLLRVHNVPVDSAVYAALLDAGVDLVGTKRLAQSHALLVRLARPRDTTAP